MSDFFRQSLIAAKQAYVPGEKVPVVKRVPPRWHGKEIDNLEDAYSALEFLDKQLKQHYAKVEIRTVEKIPSWVWLALIVQLGLIFWLFSVVL